MRNYVGNPKGITTVAQAASALHAASHAFRQVMPIAYGLVHYTLLECHDKIKEHPRYKHDVKQAFKQCIEEFAKYEHGLLYSPLHLFRVADLAEESRRQYKDDLTDKEYFEMWLSYGAYAYDKYRPMLLSLEHKYELFLTSKGVGSPEYVAWGCVGKVACGMAQQSYQELIKQIYNVHGLPKEEIEKHYSCLSLEHIKKQWGKAVHTIFDDGRVPTTAEEERNLSLGIENVYRAYSKQYLTQDNELQVLGDSVELFKTKGFHKKRMIQAAEINEKYKVAVQQGIKTN